MSLERIRISIYGENETSHTLPLIGMYHHCRLIVATPPRELPIEKKSPFEERVYCRDLFLYFDITVVEPRADVSVEQWGKRGGLRGKTEAI